MIKKIIFSILIVLLLIVIGVVVYNSVDESLNPKAYTPADLKPTFFDAANGYYILWGLAEPFLDEFDPAERGKKFAGSKGAFNHLPDRKAFEIYKKAIRTLIFPPNDLFDKDWITQMNPQEEKLSEAQKTCVLLLKRYGELIKSPRISDFSYPAVDTEIPNLLGLLYSAKLYTTIEAIKAVNGQWQEGVAGLLVQVDFARKFVSNSRPLINNLIAKAIMNYSLLGLVSIMNHPGCPSTVYAQVLEGLPPLKYEEYGNRNSFIFECLTGFGILDELPRFVEDGEKRMEPITKPGFFGRFFLQKNTTKNYFYEYFSRLIAYDTQEPYLWKTDPKIELDYMITSKISGFFWKLKNPVGKEIFSIFAPGAYGVFFKGYRLRSRYEMTRILAELKSVHAPGKKVGDILPQLKSYGYHDPFSGKPYRWNPDKKVLYSIGIDGVDNGGVEKSNFKTDIIVPVVIKE